MQIKQIKINVNVIDRKQIFVVSLFIIKIRMCDKINKIVSLFSL